MITRTMTYMGVDGEKRTEEFCFNLNKAEVAKMELRTGGLTDLVKRAVNAQDRETLLEVFEELIQKSFGVKTPDGRGFRKRKEDLEAFIATEAYSDLYMELISDDKAAAEFFNGILPSNLDDQATPSTN